MDQEDIKLIHRFEELSHRGEDYYVYTDFLTIHEQSLILGMGCKASFWGGTEDCERKIAAFGNESDLGYSPSFPIVCIRCTPKDQRYADALSHRDVLGSVLGLGIDRSCVGDIFLLDNVVYLFVAEHMGTFITESLVKIRHTDVVSEICQPDMQKLASKLTPVDAICASGRIDAAVAGVYHLSRSEASELIERGLVLKNGREVISGSEKLCIGDILSVRGCGRFRFEREGRITGSGRVHLHVSIYG